MQAQGKEDKIKDRFSFEESTDGFIVCKKSEKRKLGHFCIARLRISSNCSFNEPFTHIGIAVLNE